MSARFGGGLEALAGECEHKLSDEFLLRITTELPGTGAHGHLAGTDNGESIYWARTPSSGPDDWTIVVNAARDWEDWPAFEGGLVEFLVVVFATEYQCSAFPQDFPSTSLPLSF